MRAEVLGDRGDGRDHPWVHGVAGLGVLDGVAEDGVQRQGAVVAQQGQPGADGAGDRGGEEAGTGNQLESELSVGLDRRSGGCDTLTREHHGPSRVRPAPAGEEDGDLATRTVEVRLDDLEGETGGDGGVERVAAGLEDRHACGRREPVGGGDHAEGAGELGAGGEHASTLGVVRPFPPLGTRERRRAGTVPGVQGVLAAGDHPAAATSRRRGAPVVGVLGSSRRTTGPSVRTTGGTRGGCTGAPGPQDRWAPPGPAPHRDARSTSRPTRTRRRPAAREAGGAATGAVTLARGAGAVGVVVGRRRVGTGRAGGSARVARPAPARW